MTNGKFPNRQAGENCVTLAGTITRSAFLGSLIRYWVQIASEEWIVDQADPGANTRPFEGDVSVGFEPERVHIIG